MTADVSDALAIIVSTEQVNWRLESIEIRNASGLVSVFEYQKEVKAGREVEIFPNWRKVRVPDSSGSSLVGTKWTAIDQDITLTFGKSHDLGRFNIDNKLYNHDMLWFQVGDAVKFYYTGVVNCAPCFQLHFVDGELTGDYFSAAEAHHHVTLLKA